MDRRSALLAASQPTFNGNELPTEIPVTSPSTEELKNLFSFLSSLTVNGSPVITINKYSDRIYIATSGSAYTNLYQDGYTSSTSSGAGGGGGQ